MVRMVDKEFILGKKQLEYNIITYFSMCVCMLNICSQNIFQIIFYTFLYCMKKKSLHMIKPCFNIFQEQDYRVHRADTSSNYPKARAALENSERAELVVARNNELYIGAFNKTSNNNNKYIITRFFKGVSAERGRPFCTEKRLYMYVCVYVCACVFTSGAGSVCVPLCLRE